MRAHDGGEAETKNVLRVAECVNGADAILCASVRCCACHVRYVQCALYTLYVSATR